MKYIYLSILSALLLCGCNKEDDNKNTTPVQLQAKQLHYVIAPNPFGGAPDTTAYYYDNDGRCIKMTTASGETTFAYNGNTATSASTEYNTFTQIIYHLRPGTMLADSATVTGNDPFEGLPYTTKEFITYDADGNPIQAIFQSAEVDTQQFIMDYTTSDGDITKIVSYNMPKGSVGIYTSLYTYDADRPNIPAPRMPGIPGYDNSRHLPLTHNATTEGVPGDDFHEVYEYTTYPDGSIHTRTETNTGTVTTYIYY